MRGWLFGFLKRFVLFNIFVIGLVRAYSWLFAYDDAFKAWALQNRGPIAIILGMSAIIYAMYDWIEDSERRKEK